MLSIDWFTVGLSDSGSSSYCRPTLLIILTKFSSDSSFRITVPWMKPSECFLLG